MQSLRERGSAYAILPVTDWVRMKRVSIAGTSGFGSFAAACPGPGLRSCDTASRPGAVPSWRIRNDRRIIAL
jgi:hypothetical protein